MFAHLKNMNSLVKPECIIQYEEIDKTNLTSLTVEQQCANAGATGSGLPTAGNKGVHCL